MIAAAGDPSGLSSTATVIVALAAVAGTLLGAALGALGAWLVGRGQQKVQTREETMRTLRWAVDFALDPDEGKAAVGFAGLRALAESKMLQPADVPFLTTVSDAILDAWQEQWETRRDGGDGG